MSNRFEEIKKQVEEQLNQQLRDLGIDETQLECLWVDATRELCAELEKMEQERERMLSDERLDEIIYFVSTEENLDGIRPRKKLRKILEGKP